MANADLSVFYVDDSFLPMPRVAKSKTDRTVPFVEDRCTYIKEKKGTSGSDAQLIRNAGHTRKLSLSRNKPFFSMIHPSSNASLNASLVYPSFIAVVVTRCSQTLNLITIYKRSKSFCRYVMKKSPRSYCLLGDQGIESRTQYGLRCFIPIGIMDRRYPLFQV